MGGLFSSPAAPVAPLPPAAPPEKSASEVRSAEQRRRQMAAGAKGQTSTILTGPMGVDDSEAGGKKALLGQ
tara:strand:- start:4027 stop:4239 length:213 start_codon:yes stop_codon:yes gene_type:complete